MEDMKKSNWKNMGGDLRMYIPSRSIYAVKAFRYLGIPNLFHVLVRKTPKRLETRLENAQNGKRRKKTA